MFSKKLIDFFDLNMLQLQNASSDLGADVSPLRQVRIGNEQSPEINGGRPVRREGILLCIPSVAASQINGPEGPPQARAKNSAPSGGS